MPLTQLKERVQGLRSERKGGIQRQSQGGLRRGNVIEAYIIFERVAVSFIWT